MESPSYQLSQQLLKIEKLVYGGDGLSRGGQGVVLVPFTLGGETVEADVGPQQKGVLRGKLERVIEASPDRIDPQCPYFPRCGGCHYQHATYAAQLTGKQAILEETLFRSARITPPAPIAVIAGEPWHYRNRVQLHFENGRMGFRASHSRNLIEIDHCPISSPKLNDCIGKMSSMARDARWPRFLQTIELFTNEESLQLNVVETERPVARRFFEWCAEEIAALGLTLAPGALNYTGFQVSKGSFFQVNRFLIDRLVEEVVGGQEGETALDLYAGVGLFSLPLARSFRRVIAVESGSGAVRDLVANAGDAYPSIEPVRNSVDQFLAGFTGPCDLVVADPPRAGLGKLAVPRLLTVAPRRIVLVACDPATMARDLAPLLAGGYALQRVALIDLFPQTYHVEAVAKLERI
jgi:23S rRNA (uracil1939-C5)-methyltransferase